jgi:hypothetical protein
MASGVAGIGDAPPENGVIRIGTENRIKSKTKTVIHGRIGSVGGIDAEYPNDLRIFSSLSE